MAIREANLGSEVSGSENLSARGYIRSNDSLRITLRIPLSLRVLKSGSHHRQIPGRMSAIVNVMAINRKELGRCGYMAINTVSDATHDATHVRSCREMTRQKGGRRSHRRREKCCRLH